MPEIPDFTIPMTGGKTLSQWRQEWWDHLQVSPQKKETKIEILLYYCCRSLRPSGSWSL